MTKPEHPLISLCMIVKNEEKNIVRCLKSVTSYVDEIIVLDTGSTDQTPYLATKLGATVYYGIWENDFSKARNFSKQYAKGDWIFFLDADEELPPETGKALRQLAQNPNVEAYTFSIINYTFNDTNSQKQIGINLRMFRNNPNYTFAGALHEQVKPSILQNNPQAVILHANLSILHYGYSNDNPKRREKNLRNIEILEKVVQENPNDYFSHYNLAVSYYVNGKLEKARTHFQLARDHTADKTKYLPALFRNYSVCLSDLGQYEDALNLLKEGIAQYPDYPDLYYLQGQIYVTLKLFKEAELCFNRCLKFTKCNPGYVSTQGVTSFLSYEYLADIYFYQQNRLKALEYQLKVINNGAQTFEAVQRLAYFAYQYFKDNGKTYLFLKEYFPELNPTNMLKVLFHINCYDLVLQEIELIKNPEPETLFLAAKTCMYLDDWQGVKKYITQIAEDSPYYEEVQVLGVLSCCLQDTDAITFINKISLFNPDLAEACRLINDMFRQNRNSSDLLLTTNNFCHQSPVTNYFVKLIYQLMLYNTEKTLQILQNNFKVDFDFPYLCYKIGELAFSSGNFSLTQELLVLAIKHKLRTPDVYRLLGEVLINLGEKNEGLYLIRYAVSQEPNKAENYQCLIKYVVTDLEEKVRTILNIYPSFSMALHHLCALATFREKLTRKDVLT